MVAASGSVPPVSAFDKRDDVRHHAGGLAGEQAAGAAEAGEDFVEDQQQLVAVGRLAQPVQHRGVVEAHAAGALHQRLDDDAGELVGVAFEQIARTQPRSPRPAAASTT